MGSLNCAEMCRQFKSLCFTPSEITSKNVQEAGETEATHLEF